MDYGNRTLVINLQKDIVQLLSDKVAASAMTSAQAAEIAKFVLTHVPENTTDEQLKNILPSLAAEHKELAGIVAAYIKRYTDQQQDAIIKQVELDTLKAVNEKMARGELTREQAGEIAAYVLKSLKPHMSIHALWHVAKHFDDHFPELRKVVIDVEDEYVKQVRRHVLQQVDKLIAEGKIAEADELLATAIKREGEMASNILPYEEHRQLQDAKLSDPKKELEDLAESV